MNPPLRYLIGLQLNENNCTTYRTRSTIGQFYRMPPKKIDWFTTIWMRRHNKTKALSVWEGERDRKSTQRQGVMLQHPIFLGSKGGADPDKRKTLSKCLGLSLCNLWGPAQDSQRSSREFPEDFQRARRGFSSLLF